MINISHNKRFIVNAIVLTIFTLLMRAIGTFFGVYLSNKIGPETIGLYQIVSSVYLLAITIAISGIGIAIVRLVSEQIAKKNYYRAKVAFSRCVKLSFLLSVTASVLMFFNAREIGCVFLKDERTISSLKLLSFELPFLAVSACIRNFFIASKMINKTVIGDVIEQMFLIVCTVPLVTLMLPKGIESACCAVVIGGMVGEICSCLYVVVAYLVVQHKSRFKKSNKAGVWSEIFKIAAPVALGNYVRNALVSIENVLIPAGLKKHGSSKGMALASYGMIKGMVMPILTFPSAILGAFSSLLIPEVSENNAVNNRSKIEYIIDKSLGATLIFSVIVTAVFFCFSKEIGNIFYKSEQCGNLMLILTPLIPLLYLDSIVDSLLKGLNQQLSAMKYNTADSVIRVVLIYFLVPNLGVWGYIAVLFVGTIFNFSMSLNRLIKVSQVKIKWDKWVIKPLIGAGVALLITKTVFLLFKDFGMGMTVGTFIKIGIILVFYYLFLRVLGVITKKEVLWIKYALQDIKG